MGKIRFNMPDGSGGKPTKPPTSPDDGGEN